MKKILIKRDYGSDFSQGRGELADGIADVVPDEKVTKLVGFDHRTTSSA
jgi:hypothetical protein